jgi:ornithine cyclodeaminase
MSESHLTEADVRRLLDPAQLIPAIALAFRDRYPSVIIPQRTQTQLAHGTFLSMSCYDPLSAALGMKLVLVREKTVDAQNLETPSRSNEIFPGRDGTVQAAYLLLDPETAQPRLTIEANYLTDLRTTATSALATKFLAPANVSTLGIFGTGRLARAHLAVLPLVRGFQRVLICGRNAASSAEFVRQSAAEMQNLEIAAADPGTCVRESEILCACTSSRTPLFDGRDLRPGSHLNLVGSFRPQTREVDTCTIQRSRVVVDTYATAAEVGDILIPLHEAAIPQDHVAADLHELVSGKKQGRRNLEDITIFKSAGCALEDLVAAELLLAANSAPATLTSISRDPATPAVQIPPALPFSPAGVLRNRRR